MQVASPVRGPTDRGPRGHGAAPTGTVGPGAWLRGGPVGEGMVQLWQGTDSDQNAVDLVASDDVPEIGWKHVLEGQDENERMVALIHEDYRAGKHEQEADPADVIEIGDVRLDAGRHEVFVRGMALAFPLKEFELLELLLTNAGRVLTRDVLIDRIWGPNYFGDTKTLDVHVKRLRSKIEIDPANPKRIGTVRGVGCRDERAGAAAS